MSVYSHVTPLPVGNGKQLEIIFLSWLVTVYQFNHPDLHNQYIASLVAFISADKVENTAVKAYRKLLQDMLESSFVYDVNKTQSIIPVQFVHEHALLLSRLRKHEEVCCTCFYMGCIEVILRYLGIEYILARIGRFLFV